jgi:2-polyprenyl-6-methoxyphenol hydroxylase-like FAD-dependent oxidoreductase
LGVTIEREVELISFSHDVDGVEAVLLHKDDHQEVVLTDWLLGCDGAHSVVRHGLGAPFTGETMNSDWMLADIHMSGYPYPDTEAAIYWHHDGIFVVFPISPGRYRVIADLPPTTVTSPPTPTLDQVQAVMDRRGPGGLKAHDPIWLAGFRINGRKVAGYRWGRVFLAGDAAHVHSPAGGQGMNTGMQDAFNLAWKLALVVRGICDESLLDSYSPERSSVGDEVLKTTARITTIGTLHNPVAQTIRNLVGHVMLGLSPVQHALADTMTETTIGYPKSPLNGRSLGGAGPRPGERVVPIAGQRPAGSGDTPRFALFAAHTPAIVGLFNRFNKLLDPDVRPPLREEGIWLVRPDGYVACSSNDPEVIGEYLEKIRWPDTLQR